jgi:hypothetical protein
MSSLRCTDTARGFPAIISPSIFLMLFASTSLLRLGGVLVARVAPKRQTFAFVGRFDAP